MLLGYGEILPGGTDAAADPERVLLSERAFLWPLPLLV